MKTVKVYRSTAYVPIPSLAHTGSYPDIGYDLYSTEYKLIQPGEVALVSTGIRIELPKATRNWVWEAEIRPRSGLRKLNIIVSHGTIDSGYRGDLGALVHNYSTDPYAIYPADKIAQLIISKKPRVKLKEVKEGKQLSKTARGSNGFGSTGR